MMNVGLKAFRARNRVMGMLLPDKVALAAADMFLTPRSSQPKPWELSLEERGKRQQTPSGISVISWGEERHKRVLMVHGWESRATQLGVHIDKLCAAGYQVFAMDGPGHGFSLQGDANPLSFSEAVVDVWQSIGPFDAMIGHSMGGNAVANALLREGLYCPRLVLISSPASIEAVLKAFSDFIGLPQTCSEKFIETVETRVGIPASELDLSRSSPERAATLVIHDEADSEIPFDQARQIVKAWDNARLFASQGFGHRKILKQPEIWDVVSEFLS